MPCPKVGLKLATASPNGRIPAGKRSSLWYRRHRLVGYLWNATSLMGSPCRMAAARCGGNDFVGQRAHSGEIVRRLDLGHPERRQGPGAVLVAEHAEPARLLSESACDDDLLGYQTLWYAQLMCGVADADVHAGLGRAVKSPLLQPDRQSGAPARGVDDEVSRNLLAGVEPHACHLLAHRVEARFGDPRARAPRSIVSRGGGSAIPDAGGSARTP